MSARDVVVVAVDPLVVAVPSGVTAQQPDAVLVVQSVDGVGAEMGVHGVPLSHGVDVVLMLV